MNGPSDALIVRDVVIRRSNFTLGPISFRVPPGTRLGLRGPNGCGKTTLLLAVAGLVEISSGEIRLGDRLLSGPDRAVEPRQRGVALLLQELGLFPHLTLARQCQLVAGSTDERVVRVAESLGVSELLARKPGDLSGGEAQRCALVRTLASRSPVVLLDEPLASQHESGRARVERVIEDERSEGAAVVVASHIDTPCDEFLDLGVRSRS